MGVEKMELRINRMDDETHAAAKFLAARMGVSLNKFCLDAIRDECLRVAIQHGLGNQLLKKIDNKQPARS